MFGINDFNINFLTQSQIIIWPVLILLLILAVYLYLRTNPPIPRYLKIILSSLRMIAVIALMAALLEPVISYTTEYEREKQIAVLLDYSQSMEKIESDKSRKARLDSLLSGHEFEFIKNNFQTETYYFGENLSSTSDKVDGSQTSLGSVLKRLNTSELSKPSDYWLLFSDGRSNAGEAAQKIAKELSSPVMAVNISGQSNNFDIGINNVDYNPVLFMSEPTEIKVKLSWQEALGKSINIELSDENRIVSTKTFKIDQDNGFGEVVLKYTPDKAEQKILKLNIPQFENEENKNNNSYSFSIKVLKNKLEILIAAPAPDYETGFLKRFFSKTDKYKVTLVVPSVKTGNIRSTFPSRQTEINKYDLIILQDPPVAILNNHKSILTSYLADKGGAIWILTGENFAKSKTPDWLNSLFPFSLSKGVRPVYSQFNAVPSEDQLFHPAIRIGENQESIRARWAELPPFQFFIPCDMVSDNAVILAYKESPIQNSPKYPLLGFKRTGPGKVFLTSAFPFWNWGFGNIGLGQDDESYGKFLEGISSWLTVKDDFDPVRVIPKKKIFNRGEKIRFDGFAFDLGFRPLPEISGTVKVESADKSTTRETDLLSLGEGKYMAEFFNLNPGKYNYTATIEKDERLLKLSKGEILIQSFSLEQFDQSGDPQTLRAIAKETGGSYLEYNNFAEILSLVDPDTVLETEHHEISIWNKTWLLLLFIFALSAEWLLRKANQLL